MKLDLSFSQTQRQTPQVSLYLKVGDGAGDKTINSSVSKEEHLIHEINYKGKGRSISNGDGVDYGRA